VALQADYDERGLLGLAFHPAFDTNGRLFVYYGAPTRPGASGDHTNRLSEFRVDPADPLHVDPATERVLLEFEQPQFNHSGGGLGFGPDGLLYLGTGDGGGQGDASVGHSQQGNAQDRSKLNGKILRIDVDDGPVTRPEIYAYGFRNPWRLAWEPDGLRRLLVSDVGYGRYEEIDVVDRGANYGWRIREGRHCLDVDHPLETVTDCPTAGAGDEPLVDPVVEYSHAEIGIAVVGGYVYRGVSLPAFAGRYVFADFTRDWKGPVPTPRANLLIADPQPEGVAEWPWRPLRLQGGLIPRFVTGMGEDASGELYVLSRDELGPTGDGGVVLRIVPPGP
jgi:glucose/arabinose dehydrogenase